ncbi:MAG: hypothetical protein QM697_17645 [Lachnospiraceae bacterium]
MKSDKSQILNILLIVLAVLLVINVFATASSLIVKFERYVPTEEIMLYHVKNGEYGNLVYSVNGKKYSNQEDSQTYRELYAVAGYFEAASLYHAYQEIGNTEEEAKLQKKMEENSTLLGELSFTKEDIDNKLGIQ